MLYSCGKAAAVSLDTGDGIFDNLQLPNWQLGKFHSKRTTYDRTAAACSDQCMAIGRLVFHGACKLTCSASGIQLPTSEGS